jgi:hypothetical protein
MSEAYTTTVIIERTIEIEVEVRVVPDEPATYWEPGCAGEACIEDAWIDPSGAGKHPSLSDEESAKAIKLAIKQGPPEPAPYADDGALHPF